jgi:AcrR family transcriptional regulator
MTETNTSQRNYHHGDLRNALIEAGRVILAEEGSAGLELRKVARRAGVSHAAPYRHFADKQALLAAIAEDGFRELLNRLQTAHDQAEINTLAQLTAIGQAYMAFALECPAHMREMFSGLTIDRYAYPSLHAVSKEAFTLLVTTVAAGQARGEVVSGNPADLVVTIWSMIHGVAMLVLERQIPMQAERDAHQLVQSAIEQLYAGLRN